MGFTRGEIVLDRRLPSLFGERDRRGGAALTSAVEVLRGPQAIAGKRNLLRELSLRTGQAAAMENLDVWLDTPAVRAKIPTLVLVGARNPMHASVRSDRLCAGDVDGAVLVFEYCIAGRGTGVLVTGDSNGDHTVFAPTSIRAEIAEIAARTLVEQGATVALISLQGDLQPSRLPCANAAAPAASPHGSVASRAICLWPPPSMPPSRSWVMTPDATSGAIGGGSNETLPSSSCPRYRWTSSSFSPSTARPPNVLLRRSPWRCGATSRCRAASRSRSSRGLRCCDGQWLSVIAGHRQPGTLVIDWQINRAGLPRYSLCTVMRSFLMEHEIAQGTQRLYFEGGTPHSIRHSFACVEASDVLVQRRLCPKPGCCASSPNGSSR